MTDTRFDAIYAVRADAASIAGRADVLALEQSVEMPLAAVRDPRVRDQVVARVQSISQRPDGRYAVHIAMAIETVGSDPGQLLNMLIGNSSLHDDVELVDVDLPDDYAWVFAGPRYGSSGWRAALDAIGRPLTCAALKPLGLTADDLAKLAGVYAHAGIDVIKDDHGLADQDAAPFAKRVVAVQRAIDDANRATGFRTIYAPSLTGSHDALRQQMQVVRDHDVGAVLMAPMISGVAALGLVAREAQVPVLAHPALAGCRGMAPPLLLGKLFRLFGADATIFPNAGGRFGYTRETCAAIAHAARAPWCGLRPSLPVPAGGMTVERVPELRATFGDDAMLLIGGSLLVAGDELANRCRAFVAAVREPVEIA
jgi:ribulose-bisphosphate carboxylase large chain